MHRNEYLEIHGNAYKQRDSVDFCIVEAETFTHLSQNWAVFECFSVS